MAEENDLETATGRLTEMTLQLTEAQSAFTAAPMRVSDASTVHSVAKR